MDIVNSDTSTFLIKSSKNRSFGTGFCIYKDSNGSYLLTAAHVVESCGLDTLLVDALDEHSQQIIAHSAKVLHISNDVKVIDLAVIYVKGLVNTRALKISNEIREFNVKEDTFEIDGFRSHKNMFTNNPLKGYIKKSYQLQSDSNQRWLYDLVIDDSDSIVQGYSGSAIVCSLSGLVLGIATDRNRSGKQAYAIPAYYLKHIWTDIPSEEIVEPLEKNNPYKGLSSFEYKDRENYYGRDRESTEIATDLKKTKLFTLLGASGSGKSSLIFAGIKPLIEDDEVGIVDFRPQNRAFQNLASIFIPLLYSDRLEQIRKNNTLSQELMNFEIKLDDLVANLLQQTEIKHLYIVIDQFEEIFTLSQNPKEKNTFLDQLLTLINSEHPITLLISMRSDFLSHISFYEPFNKAFNEHKSTSLSLLSSENLKKVIEEPSKKLGVRFEDGLVNRIIEEIENEAGQLPLLEFALEQFWNKRKGRFITHSILDDMQSISHSISHYADNIYAHHTKHQNSIKKILIKLVNPGSGTEDTRRVASIEDFNKDELEVVQLLANERLVITRDKSVDIVHEALLREWKLLKGWIDEYREFLEWQKKLRDDRANYVANAKKDTDKNLLTESKLLRAKEFLESHKAYISEHDRAFILKSIEVAQRKKRNRNIALISGFVFLIGVIVVIWFFFKEADQAKVETQSKLYDNLVQQGITARDYLNDPLKSRLVFANAKAISSLNEQEEVSDIFLHTNFMKRIKLQSITKEKQNDMSSDKQIYIKLHNSKMIWSDTYIKVFDINNKVKFLINDKFINKVQLNKNEKRLFYLTDDSNKVFDLNQTYYVTVCDIENNNTILKLNHDNRIKGALFTPDGSKILSWSEREMKLWDAITGKLLHIYTNNKDNKEHSSIQFGLDLSFDNAIFISNRIISWGGSKISLWDLEKEKRIMVFEHQDKVNGVVIGNYFDREILSWSKDGTVKLWRTWVNIPLQTFNHNTSVLKAMFNHDRTKILSWSKDKEIKVWKRQTNRTLFNLKHNDPIHEAGFVNNGKEIFSKTEGGIIRRWIIDDSNRLIKYVVDRLVSSNLHIGQKEKLLSWTGSKIKISYKNNKFLTFDIKDWIQNVTFNRDETKILLSTNHKIETWSIKNQKKLFSLNFSNPKGVIFNEDETKILIWIDKELKLYSLLQKKELFSFKLKKNINGVRLNKNEKKIVTWDNDRVTLWNIQNNKLIFKSSKICKVTGAHFNKDETKILFWNNENIKVWNIKSDIVTSILGEPYTFKKVIFSNNEKVILFIDNEKRLYLWSIQYGKELLTLSNVLDAKFSKEDKKLIVVESSYYRSDKIGQGSSNLFKKNIKVYDLSVEREVVKSYYPLKTQVETGAYLTPSGEVKALTKKEWEVKKVKYEKILAESKD